MPVISTNTAANSAVRYLNINSKSETASLSKLASGSRITQASDDAAGLAISTKISSDVTALDQAATNASHGVSILQTADGGASNVSDILQRMKALASESASGTVTDTERTYINAEFSQLTDEIDGTATSTRYNGQSLLDGTSSGFSAGLNVIVGSDASDTISIKLDTLTSAALGLTATTASAATAAVATSSKTSGTVYNAAASGASTSFSVNGTTVSLSATGGTGGDGLYTATDLSTAINTALTAAGNTAVTASVASSGALELDSAATGSAATITLAGAIDASDLGFSAAITTGTDAIAVGDKLSVSTQTGATSAIANIDTAISTVSKARADIGATESRFNFRSESIATSSENLTAAKSAISDTDVAAEEAKLASAQVKTQAAVAAASSANQMTQALLKLMQ